MTEVDNKNRSSNLSKFNLFLIICLGIAMLIQKGEEQKTIEDLAELKKYVDFSESSIQPINDGFLLSQASQEKHLTGIKFRGRIINTESVVHRNVTFNLFVDGRDKEFFINQISPGNSTGFNIYVSDLEAENARYAEIKYVRSLVFYNTK